MECEFVPAWPRLVAAGWTRPAVLITAALAASAHYSRLCPLFITPSSSTYSRHTCVHTRWASFSLRRRRTSRLQPLSSVSTAVIITFFFLRGLLLRSTSVRTFRHLIYFDDVTAESLRSQRSVVTFSLEVFIPSFCPSSALNKCHHNSWRCCPNVDTFSRIILLYKANLAI